MSALRVEVDPSEAGLDASRLARIDAYFRRYTDDGRLAGWLVLVSRGGKIAHLETYGRRDETGTPIEVDTLFRMYSMTFSKENTPRPAKLFPTENKIWR